MSEGGLEGGGRDWWGWGAEDACQRAAKAVTRCGRSG